MKAHPLNKVLLGHRYGRVRFHIVFKLGSQRILRRLFFPVKRNGGAFQKGLSNS